MTIQPTKNARAQKGPDHRPELRESTHRARTHDFSRLLKRPIPDHERRAPTLSKGKTGELPSSPHMSSVRRTAQSHAETAPDPLPTAGRAPRRMHSERENAQDARRDDHAQDRTLGQREEMQLPAFSPPPAILLGPVGSAPVPGESSVSGSAQAHAETAAMADRLLQSMRVGRSASGGHEVRLRLAPTSRYAGVEVRLEDDGGTLRAKLVVDAGGEGRAEELAQEMVRELRERGLELSDIEIERA